jgi:uncharacterized oligopeptide transporter (OPT) family protein
MRVKLCNFDHSCSFFHSLFITFISISSYQNALITCAYRFYFDFSAMYIGLGMICPYVINIALLIGGIVSWGFLYPYIESKQGDWYDEKSPTSLNGANGYKVCMTTNKQSFIDDCVINFLVRSTQVSLYMLYVQKALC